MSEGFKAGKKRGLLAWLRHGWALTRATAALLRGDARGCVRALDVAELAVDDVEAVRLRMAALGMGRRAGEARKVMKAALADWEGRLQGCLDEAERKVLAAAVAGEGAVPLHLLGRLERRMPGWFEVEGLRVDFLDGPSAGSAYQEIFVKRMYDVPAGKCLRVIDGGANIGLTAVFFQLRHAGARLTCFEADPQVAQCLRKNLARMDGIEAEVVEAALWGEDGVLNFAAEGADAGRVSEQGGGEVRALRLSPYLEERVDLLKLDIEGAELAVLRECRGRLGLVQRIFVEYHSFVGQPQGLDELLGILREAGFRVFVTVSDVLSWRPLVERVESLGMDMRLNLFGVREG